MACHAKWFISFPWLHYVKEPDFNFCFTCMKNIEKENLITTVRRDQAFILVGCSDETDALDNFKSQEQSHSHGIGYTWDYTAPQCRDIHKSNDNYNGT